MSTPHPFDPNVFSGDSSLKLLTQTTAAYDNFLRSISYAFANNMTGQLRNQPLDDIIYSLRMRNSSLHYHYSLIINTSIDASDYLNTPKHLKIKTEKLFLFDSFIFHLVSSTDYFACLIYYVLTNSQDYKRTWKKVYKFFANDVIFRHTELKKLFYIFHNWIDKLIEYRADLVHYGVDNAPFSTSIDMMRAAATLLVEVPINFCNKFREFKIVHKNDKSIDRVACWLLVNQTESMTQIGNLLLRHIADNKNGDFKVITFE